jgi:hypothetical protein
MLMGSVNGAAYGFHCTYEKMPFGSSCHFFGHVWAFLAFGVPTALGLYAVWAVSLMMRRMLRRTSV